MPEHDFSDADFGYEGEVDTITLGWNTTEEPYVCCMCDDQAEHSRLRGPGFFVVREDKKLEPVCFNCVEKVENATTNDQNSGSLGGLRILFKLTNRIRTSEGGDLMTLAEITGWFKALSRKMTE